MTLPPEVLDTLLASDVQQFLTPGSRPERALPEGPLFEARYSRWLDMAFEDRGYGEVGTVRAAEIFVSPRLLPIAWTES